MSRRRKHPPPNRDVIKFDAAVICTDRNRHAAVPITAFADEQEPGDGSRVAWGETRRWDLIADSRPGTLTLRFRCKRCRRDVRLQEANAVAAIEALRQASGKDEYPVLDISLLPC